MMSQNRINYDALFCGRQPLHQTNLIQPHGVLMVIGLQAFEILQVSENVSQLISLPYTDLVQQPLRNFIMPESLELLQQHAANGLFQNRIPVVLSFLNGTEQLPYLVFVHESEHTLLLEVEFKNRQDPAANSFVTVFQQLKRVTAAIESKTTLEDVCKVAAQEIKNISGFDKVMIYSFDEEWNGTVLAEEMERGMDSYLGLKFPASDIPKPARDLYLRNSYRIIPNREYEPVSLYPENNPLTGTQLNLSYAGLRSVAPVHLEYLKNMGVQASMSTRIVHKEQLWGLIACHHRTAKYLSFDECSVFEFLSNVVSSRISSIINQNIQAEKIRLNELFHQLMQQVHLYDNITTALQISQQQLLNLLQCDGVAICWDGQVQLMGLSPEPEDVEKILNWLQQKKVTELLHLRSLPQAFEPVKHIAATASGLLVLPIQPELGNYLLAFRPEEIKNVKWGGDPGAAIQFEEDSAVYHPRNSFKVWREIVRNTSEVWKEEELLIAERFRNAVVAYTLKQKNVALQLLVQEFEFVTDIMPQMVWATDAHGNHDFFNKRWYEFTGLTYDESKNEQWANVLHPEDFDKSLSAWNHSLQKGQPYEVEYRMRGNDGCYTWFLARALPLLNEQNQIIKWFGTCTNIQDQKSISELLEQKVEERTKELKQINQELERSNSELMQFTSIASHDLQEPVRKIHVFSQMVRDNFIDPENKQATDYLNRIIRSSARMRSLIIDLLEFSRLSSSIGFKQVSLNKVVQDVLADLELQIEESNAFIDIKELPVIEAKEGQMRQVFQNLISNSLKFKRPGVPVFITIRAALIEQPDYPVPKIAKGNYCLLTISDNGIGFNTKYADKIFTIFQKLHPKDQYEGTGIGLAISKKIIEMHHGSITATGEENEGATFQIILPVKQPIAMES